MATKTLKWVVMGAALISMAMFLLKNGQKVTNLATQWTDIRSGSVAPVASIILADETIYQQRLKTSDIFDATGVRQLIIMPVPRDIFGEIEAVVKTARLVINQQDIPLSSLTNHSALLAITKDRKIYLVSNDTLKPMMTIIWNEQRQLKNLVQCTSQELCNSVNISSHDWGPVEGPYSDTDISADRRGLPRGRWVRGPKTLLSIQSKTQQKVSLQINMLAVHQDQKIRFRGAANEVRKVNTTPTSMTLGDKTLYLAVYIVLLDLQSGNNSLELNYSVWNKAATEGSNPLAAYITTIGLDR